MYPVPIWHLDRQIKIRKYVSSLILFGFYTTVDNLQIVEVKVICYLILPVPIWHMDPEIKMKKYVSIRILLGFYKAVVNLQIVEGKVICYLSLPVPIWHIDRHIKIRKYVSTRILPGFYKTVFDLEIVEVKIRLLPGTTRFLSGIWIQKLKCKNMFRPGSYMVSIRQLSACLLLR